MIPVKQLYRHNPPKTYGDCHRTAIACLLNMRPQDVPHFYDQTADREPAPKAAAHVEWWLNRRGLTQVVLMYGSDVTLGDVLLTQKHVNPGIAYMLTGTSRTEVNHTVVCLDGEIVCDPSLTDAGIIGPCDDGYWWVVYLGALVGRVTPR